MIAAYKKKPYFIYFDMSFLLFMASVKCEKSLSWVSRLYSLHRCFCKGARRKLRAGPPPVRSLRRQKRQPSPLSAILRKAARYAPDGPWSPSPVHLPQTESAWRVAPSGAPFTRIQQAVNAAIDQHGAQEARIYIRIEPGIYRETVYILKAHRR